MLPEQGGCQGTLQVVEKITGSGRPPAMAQQQQRIPNLPVQPWSDLQRQVDLRAGQSVGSIDDSGPPRSRSLHRPAPYGRSRHRPSWTEGPPTAPVGSGLPGRKDPPEPWSPDWPWQRLQRTSPATPGGIGGEPRPSLGRTTTSRLLSRSIRSTTSPGSEVRAWTQPSSAARNRSASAPLRICVARVAELAKFNSTAWPVCLLY